MTWKDWSRRTISLRPASATLSKELGMWFSGQAYLGQFPVQKGERTIYNKNYALSCAEWKLMFSSVYRYFAMVLEDANYHWGLKSFILLVIWKSHEHNEISIFRIEWMYPFVVRTYLICYTWNPVEHWILRPFPLVIVSILFI